MGHQGFWRQFYALCWKNRVLKLRHWSTLLLELSLPTIIILALWAITIVIPPTNSPESIPSQALWTNTIWDISEIAPCQYEPYRNLIWDCQQSTYCPGGWVPMSEQEILGLGCRRNYIAIAPQSANDPLAAAAAAEFVSWAEADTTNFVKGNLSDVTYKYFASEGDLIDHIMDPLYVVDDQNLFLISSAVIFVSGAPNWEYTLRFNSTAVPSTELPDVDNSMKINSAGPMGEYPFLHTYILNAYSFSVSNSVNAFIATKTCKEANLCGASTNVSINMRGGVPFPNPEVDSTGFWGAIGVQFSILMIITLLYPISNMIKVLVTEKETKLREGMLMMAMRSDALWASWIFNFICLLFPLAILLTLAGSGLFVYSGKFFVFIYFFVFFMASMSYSIFISTFFSKSRTASILGSLIFFLGWFIFLGLDSSSATRSQVMLASLHPATAFTYACTAFLEYEDAQIGVTEFTWNVSSKYPATFQDMINMMFIDFWYLLILSWYFNQIWPSEFGTHKPWYFIFLPSYWSRKFCGSPNSPSYRRVSDNKNLENEIELPQRGTGGGGSIDASLQFIEPVAANFKAQLESKTCVDIQRLRKQFLTGDGVKVAVDELSLTMYSGQITALLGHNGAGKTTTIAMLTGLIPADSGTAIIEGFDLNEDMEDIRRNLGVCPQHDVLFPTLTVQEHLIMYASFKGLTGPDLYSAVEKLIVSVGLTEKRSEYSMNLSGGQKRKLSVAIAFIADSRVVFLDEPTSGMDPYSRRFTWNIIRQNKEGRVIVLTTHFMDEADLLGDRIAIMGNGKLLCCGSSIFLKKAYGVGYNITLEKTSVNEFRSDPVISLLKKHVKDFKLLSDAGKELSFQLPFSSSPSFARLFGDIDYNLNYLHLQSYGISVTTLEEVFIRITQREQASNKENLKVGFSIVPPNDIEVGQVDASFVPVTFSKLADGDHFAMFICHMHGLFSKRLFYFLRDKKTWIYQYILPVLFVLVGMIIMISTSFITNQPFKSLRSSDYNTGASSDILPFPYSNGSTFCNSCGNAGGGQNYFTSVSGQETLMSNVKNALQCPVIAVDEGINFKNMSQFLFDHRSDFKSSTFGAVSFNAFTWMTSGSQKYLEDLDYFIHANYTAPHSSHIFNTLVIDALLQSYNSSTSLLINMHTFPNTYREESLSAGINLYFVITFIMLAAPCIPAAFATFVVRERETKSKQQQMVSGVSIPAYWLSTFLWDVISYQPTVWLLIILIVIFPKTDVLGTGDGLRCVIGLLILYGSAVAGFTYLLSFLFASSAGAQIGILFIVFILGLILSIVGQVLRIIDSTHDIFMSTLRYIFMIFPPYALGDGLTNIVFMDVWGFAELNGTEKYKALDMEIAGLSLVYLGVETVFYLLLTILYDYAINTPLLQNIFCNWSSRQLMDTYDSQVQDTTEDEDVQEETARLLDDDNATESSVVLLKNLKKVYPGGKYAVRGVSLGIPNGECFGLLGINGAGKSSTLAMLTGEFPPTDGEAFIAGMNLSTNVHSCRRKIGFCPQFDALFELLTGREHLTLYARIKGIDENDIVNVVNGKLREMALEEYADRAAGTYSGGNKRKLSVAIAMIGEPSIVFLDEPSTGMDPVARRFMWEVITDIVTKREKCSVILTTHSMEECEALCTRIGIMVGGKLKCLGSSQRLRSRYGHGYQIEISYQIPDDDHLNQLTSNIVKASGTTESTAAASVLPAVGNMIGDIELNPVQVGNVFVSFGKTDWNTRISLEGSGAEIKHHLDTFGTVSSRTLANWMHFEWMFDDTCSFFKSQFGEFTVRERQINKVRYEVIAMEKNGSPRKLGTVFDSMEKVRYSLKIQEYSIAQTSLEQIFNQFASQQEEEHMRPVPVLP